MANIEVNDIQPAGAEFFADSESFLNELSNDEMNIQGGGVSTVSIVLCGGDPSNVSLALCLTGGS